MCFVYQSLNSTDIVGKISVLSWVGRGTLRSSVKTVLTRGGVFKASEAIFEKASLTRGGGI